MEARSKAHSAIDDGVNQDEVEAVDRPYDVQMRLCRSAVRRREKAGCGFDPRAYEEHELE